MVGEPLGTIALVCAVTLLGSIAGAMGVRAILLPPGRLIPKRRSPKPGPDAKAAAPHRVTPLARAAYASLGFVLIAGAAPLMAYVVEAPAMLAHVAPRRSLAYAASAFVLVLLTLAIATGCMWWFVTRSRRGDTPPAPRSRARRVSRVFLAFLLAVGLGALGWGAAEGAHARWDRVQHEWQYWNDEPWLFLAWEAIALWLALSASAFFVVAWRADPSRGRPRCPKCWYDMSGATGLLCPECGRTAKRPRALHRTRRSGALFVLGTLLAGVAYGAWATPRVSRGGVVAIVPTWALIQWWEHIPDNWFEGGTGRFVDLSLRDRSFGKIGPLARVTVALARPRAMDDLLHSQSPSRLDRAFWIVILAADAHFKDNAENAPSFSADEIAKVFQSRSSQIFTHDPVGAKVRDLFTKLQYATLDELDTALASVGKDLIPQALDWIRSQSSDLDLAVMVCVAAGGEGDQVAQELLNLPRTQRTAAQCAFALSMRLQSSDECVRVWDTLIRSGSSDDRDIALGALRRVAQTSKGDSVRTEHLIGELRAVAAAPDPEQAGHAAAIIAMLRPRSQESLDELIRTARAYDWESVWWLFGLHCFTKYSDDENAASTFHPLVARMVLEGILASDVFAEDVGSSLDDPCDLALLDAELRDSLLKEIRAIAEPASAFSAKAREAAASILWSYERELNGTEP